MSYQTPIDESHLIKDLQNPSRMREAFDVVMRTYGERMYWQIRRLVTSHDDANDILQNSFLKAWSNLQHFRGDAKLSTWLFKIAVNESLNFLNREKSRTVLNGSGDEETDYMRNLEADPYFDGDEAHRRLMAAVNALPEKQRLVFNMRYFDEMKYEAISDILGTSVGALKASYHHAMKKVTEALEI